MQDGLLVLAGLVTLVVSADILVRGSVWIALALGIRPLVVGLTVVAFGTSAPELAASLAGALGDSAGLATGTVLGSNIANIGLILGVTAMVAPIHHPDRSAQFEVRVLVAITLLSPLLLWSGGVTRAIAIGLLVGIVAFTWTMLRREMAARTVEADAEEARRHPLGATILHCSLAIVGLVGLPLGAGWLVDGAKGVATTIGLSDQVIGVAIVAVGTSLPELAASVVAATKKHSELALGNVLGSNIFNFCMVLGGTGVISPLAVTWANEGFHLLAGVAFVLVLAALLRFRDGISRPAGFLLLVGYVSYLTVTIVR